VALVPGRTTLRFGGNWFSVTDCASSSARNSSISSIIRILVRRPNTLSSPLFGLSTQILASSLGGGAGSGGLNPLYQIGGPRSIQLALKLTF